MIKLLMIIQLLKMLRTVVNMSVNVINLPQIDRVPSNCLLGFLYQIHQAVIQAYCYRSVNVITLGLAQGDHI
jgi:hypothetical protein